MKKKKIKELPFSDYWPYAGLKGEAGADNELSFRTYINCVKKNLSMESEKLKELVDVYRDHIEKVQREVMSLLRHRGLEFLPNLKEWKILRDAMAGDLKAVQKLVKANPETIYLPFIAKAMVSVIREHKNSLKGKGYIEDVKDKWEGFLTARPGGAIPYNEATLTFLRHKGRKLGLSPSDTDEKIMEGLSLSERALKQKARISNGRGRPKKH